MTPNTNQILILELADAVLRSWWVVVAGVCLGAAVSEVALLSIPSMYESDAILFADAEKLPREMGRTTVPDAPAELQLNVLRSAVLRRENIERIVDDHFEGATSPDVRESFVGQVSAGISLVSNTDPRKPLVTIRYRDTDPERAARVVNSVANLVVAQNALIRAQKAAQVTTAVESLSRGVEAELAVVGREIRALRSQYPFQTDAQRPNNEQLLRKAEFDLDAVAKGRAAARDRLDVLLAEREVPATDALPNAPSSPRQDPRVVALEDEVEKLRHKYADTHPAIQSLLREIADLRVLSSPAESPSPNDSAQTAAAEPQPFDFAETHIRAARIEVDRLAAEEVRIAVERDRYRAYLAETPRVQQDLDELSRRRDRLEREFQAQQINIDTARTGQEIEEKDLGNPFEIVRPARPSQVPAWPNRLQFLGGGVAAGVLVFVGQLLARRLLRPVIASEGGLRALSEVPLLASIPVIPTPEASRRERRTRAWNWGLSAASAMAVVAVHAYRYLG